MAKPDVHAPRGVVIIGTGGHGRQLRDIIEAEDRAAGSARFLGFLDDGTVDEELLSRNGDRLLGTTALLEDLDADVAIGVADPAARRRLGDLVLGAGRRLLSAVHPSATLGSLVEFGDGVMISGGAYVDSNTTFGRLCHINALSSIGHDSRLGDHVTVLPGARISGGVHVGDDVVIATNAVVLPGATIGDRSLISAGAIVRRYVPPDTTYLGLGKNRAG